MANQSITPDPETPRQKLAYEARKTDVQAANDTARAATQAAILINGGAATAVLAYLAKEAATPAKHGECCIGVPQALCDRGFLWRFVYVVLRTGIGAFRVYVGGILR